MSSQWRRAALYKLLPLVPTPSLQPGTSDSPEMKTAGIILLLASTCLAEDFFDYSDGGGGVTVVVNNNCQGGANCNTVVYGNSGPPQTQQQPGQDYYDTTYTYDEYDYGK